MSPAMVRYYQQNNASKLVFVFDNDGADQYTEIWADEKSGYNATLVIDYEVQSPPVAPTLTGPANGSVSVPTRRPSVGLTVTRRVTPRRRPTSSCGMPPGRRSLLHTACRAQPVLPDRPPSHRGATYQWACEPPMPPRGSVRTPPSSRSASRPTPVVTLATRPEMVFLNNAPRLESSGLDDRPAAVSVPGDGAGLRQWRLKYCGDNSWTPSTTLALSNSMPVTITVQVANGSPSLNGSASSAFTPRWGLDRALSGAGCGALQLADTGRRCHYASRTQLVIQYGSSPRRWHPASVGLVLVHRIGTQDPHLCYGRGSSRARPRLRSSIASTSRPTTTVATLDKWGINRSGPGRTTAACLPAGASTRASRCTAHARCMPGRRRVCALHLLVQVQVRAGGRTLSAGLMRSQGPTSQMAYKMSRSASAVRSWSFRPHRRGGGAAGV